MVEQASFVSRELGISREDQDAWAYRSHQRAVAAIDAGRFRDEIVPVGELEVDEAPRRDTSLEKLASLKPVFDPDGHDDGRQRPGVNDGAACVLVASEEWARRRGIEPLATIVAQGYVADEFAYLARTPAKAAGVALARAGKTIDDVEARRDQRGVLVRRDALDPAARRRRGARQRERRRRRARPSDRRLGRPDPRRRSSTSCAARAAGSASRRSAPAAARATRC